MNLSLKSILTPIGNFFGRFHTLIFVFAVVGGLIVSIYFLNSIITKTDTSNITSNGQMSDFNPETVARLRSMSTGDNAPEPNFSLRRIQPF